MRYIHNHLTQSFPWYKDWHCHPRHKHVHWLLFLIFSFLPSLAILSQIQFLVNDSIIIPSAEAQTNPPAIDTLNFSNVNWLDADVGGWNRTANLSSVTINLTQICLEYDKKNSWPEGAIVDGEGTIANPWIFVYMNGEWQAGTFEWMRLGQTCKNTGAVSGGNDGVGALKISPLSSWEPVAGELYGFMVSTLARNGERTINERSNIVMQRWPDITPGGTGTSGNSTLHRTDFLTLPDGSGGYHFTLEMPGKSSTERAQIISALKSRNYTHAYVFVINENNYAPGTVFNYYTRPVSDYRAILQQLVSAGIKPVVWLAPDDAPNFNQDSETRLPGIWNNFIPGIDDLVDGYVLGLEANEYWTENEINQLGTYLDGLTNKPIFTHWGRTYSLNNIDSGWVGFNWSWMKGALFQYGITADEALVRSKTSELVPLFCGKGKYFIAGEYSYNRSESTSRALGDAAMEEGAHGFGNGGTASNWAQTSTNSCVPVGSGGGGGIPTPISNPIPVLTSVSPASGDAGSTVTITGINMNYCAPLQIGGGIPSPLCNVMFFDYTGARSTVSGTEISSTAVTAVVANGLCPGPGTIRVGEIFQPSNAIPFTITSSNRTDCAPPPTPTTTSSPLPMGSPTLRITSFYPDTVYYGDELTIIGDFLSKSVQFYDASGVVYELTGSLDPAMSQLQVIIPPSIVPGIYTLGMTGPYGTAMANGALTVLSGVSDFSAAAVAQEATPPPTSFGTLVEYMYTYGISLVGLAVFVMILWGGFLWMTSAANPGNIATAKSYINNAILGAILLLSSYAILYTINPELVGGEISLKGLQGLVPPAQSPPIQPPSSGTCTGVSCAGDTANICSPLKPADGCNITAVNRYDSAIRAGIGSRTISNINLVSLLKAIIANESDGDITRTASDGLSAGLFQLRVATINAYKSACGISSGQYIDFNWLKNPDNVDEQACVAVEFIRSLSGVCGNNIRDIAAGYNGGSSACNNSTNCASCSMCSGQTGPTKRWECLWDDDTHYICNNTRSTNYEDTRNYAPRVEYCYGAF